MKKHPQEFSSNLIQLLLNIALAAMDIKIPIAITIWAIFSLLTLSRAGVIRSFRMANVWIRVSS